MGRELHRVPLNFNWPLNQRWGGYMNPYWSQRIECPKCEGSGYSHEYKELQKKWYGYVEFKPEDRGSEPFLPTDEIIIKRAKGNEYEARRLCGIFNSAWCYHINQDDVNALLEADRLWDFTRVPTNEDQKKIVIDRMANGENSWLPFDNGYRPTPKEVNEWSISGFGHDSSNCWIVLGAECKKLGYETECKNCNGEGNLWPNKRIKRQYDNWNRVDPPKGKGFQLWETVSEGSPISPVFPNEKKFIEYLISEGYSETAAKKFMETEWCFSGAFIDGEYKRNLETLDQE